MKWKYIVPVCSIISVEAESMLVEVSGHDSGISDYSHVKFDPKKSEDPNASDNQDYSEYEP
ncbi:hypothetical protein [Prevotella amnii]|uniref:Uncharacterized protein n=1 Tax=Prevotella amnii DNF00058 TaxID=1401066 RepID=A0A096B1Q9_9BACT|nr:hypothetical protein [Prevotella amnii]KGF52871.1 hypothetical protein HMPREF9302_01655 [Prevotella amnii DNF00058]